jgi:LydA holin phage, holin superfamily III
MRESWTEFLERIFPALLLALFGGIVRLLNRKNVTTLRSVFGGLVTSVFVGMLSFHWLTDSPLSESQRYVVTALASYGSRDVLQILEALLLRWLERATHHKRDPRE